MRFQALGLRAAKSGENIRGGADQRPGATRGAAPPGDGAQDRLGEIRRRQRVIEEAASLFALVLDPGDRGERPAFEDVRRLRGVGVGHREHVGVGIAVRVPDHDRGQVRVALRARDADHVRDRRALDAACLAGEPAPLRYVADERALEPLLRPADQRRLPAAGRAHLGQRGCGLRTVALDARRGTWLHGKPVEGVRPEG